MSPFRPITVFAPAKINLFLHIVEKRSDGYHDLDSLAVFADIGDKVLIEPATVDAGFSLHINGPYADDFNTLDRESGPASTNLVTRTAIAMAQATGRPLDMRVTLTKNLPLASGLGGGSADAAALAWGLMSLWDLPLSTPWLPELLAGLGADIPACLRCAPVRMGGVGDILDPVSNLPEMPVVLVNPDIPCPTPQVFKKFIGPMRGSAKFPEDLSHQAALIDFLQALDNDLTPAAREIVPEIGNILAIFSSLPACRLARMSGSGATVFGLFDHDDDAEIVASAIAAAHPHWWVRTGTINSPERY